MLKIRLQRVGRRNDPSFRVVVTESKRGPKTGNFLEILGSYSPQEHRRALKADRILHWISKGAQVSGTMHNLLITEGIREGKKINVLPRKTPIKKDEEAAPAAAAEVPAAAPEAVAETTPEVVPDAVPAEAVPETVVPEPSESSQEKPPAVE